jgi:hypothetical protein
MSLLNSYAKRVGFMLSIRALMGFYSSLGNSIWRFSGLHALLAWGGGGSGFGIVCQTGRYSENPMTLIVVPSVGSK